MMRRCERSAATGVLLSGRNCDVFSLEAQNLNEAIQQGTHQYRTRLGVRLRVALPLLTGGLILALGIGLFVGYQPIDLASLRNDPLARAVFLHLRVPRVLMAALVGASLATVGAALQALFRNPLAEPYTLGVSGGASLGASVAIALGLGLNIGGVPFVFVAAFAGAGLSVFL